MYDLPARILRQRLSLVDAVIRRWQSFALLLAIEVLGPTRVFMEMQRSWPG